ncbi:hypothetical protein PROFUN_02944 [Planoprotostelium fungivorum]|uniref:Trafficking protein particle complex subunit 8-like n=1 Tax=Planoprotostelium fungivorum TaxID=1890364 RepID=A0A2P6NX48_9EUKA|nr:hypothetical protein PROFUN_02944 [Planoprotostelium fungivorum]
MNLDLNGLSHLVKSNFIPVVLVIYDPSAETICQKNNLNLVQLLSKFSFSFLNEQTKVKTIGEQPYDIRGFQVRFTSLKELEVRCSPPEEQEPMIDNYLTQISAHHAEERTYGNGSSITSASNLIDFKTAVLGGDPTPWFTHYRWHYLRSLGVSDTEFFEHPVAALLVTGSSVSNPNEVLINLFNDRNPPQIFTKGLMDTNITKFYLLLDDAQTENTGYAKKFEEMKVTFERSKCHMLRINNLTETNFQGNFLSPQDLKDTENFVKELIFKGVLPTMERNVLTLNEFVINTRNRGIGGQIRGWFGLSNKKKGNTPGAFAEKETTETVNPTGSAYSFNSVESSQKRLADYLFMLQDYTEALNMYRNSSKDYSNDKAWRWLAAGSEMAGLASFLLDPSRKDPESFFENAYVHYYKDGALRFAVRTAFFCAELLKLKGQFVTAGNKLANTAIDLEHNQLCSAMLYEQAAFAFLNADHGRKFSFRIVQSGSAFLNANQPVHSFRCFSTIQPMYQKRQWQDINDEVNFLLARSSFLLDKSDLASFHIRQLLEHNDQSPFKQSSYLREFLHICRKNMDESKIDRLQLPLPAIRSDTVVAFLRDYPPRSPIQEMWNSMEESLTETGLKKFGREKKKPKGLPRLAVLGEPVYVEIELQNPLQIPLQFTQMKLNATHKGETDGEGVEVPFSTTQFDLLLTPNECTKTRFCITPLAEGELHISSIDYVLCSTIPGTQNIELPKRRLNNTHQEKRGIFYENNTDLTLRVTSSMPLLDVHVEDFPVAMVQGQVRCLQMLLKNSGKSALKNVRCKFLYPAFFHFGEIERQTEDGSLVKLQVEKLEPGEEISLPLWVRAHKVGNFSFHFLFSYQPVVNNSAMKNRFHRFTKQMKVLPSIKVSATSSVSYSSLNAYLLNLEVTNLTSIKEEGSSRIVDDFELVSISSVSPGWIVQPLSHDEEGKMFKLSPEQTTNLFFRIIPANKESPTENGLYHTKHQLLNVNEEEIPSQELLEREKLTIEMKDRKRNNAHKDNNMDLVISWRTTADFNSLKAAYGGHTAPSSVRGQQNICFVPFLSPATVDQTLSESEDNALRFSIESPRKVIHDFSQDILCMVPVVFHVSNISAKPLTFSLETLKPHEDLSSSAAAGTPPVSKRSAYFWADTTFHMVHDLMPDTSVSLDMSVCFSSPGVFNLNRYKFSIKDDKRRNAGDIYSNYQHILTVEDKNENN